MTSVAESLAAPRGRTQFFLCAHLIAGLDDRKRRGVAAYFIQDNDPTALCDECQQRAHENLPDSFRKWDWSEAFGLKEVTSEEWQRAQAMNRAPDIRIATAADAPHMSALIRRTVRISNVAEYAPAVIDHLIAEFSPEKVLARMDGRDVFVLCENEAVIGTVSFGLAAGKLHSMFVDPDRQGKGLGRELVAHLERHARGKGFEEIIVSSSLTARPFYEKLGYVSLAYEDKPGAATWFMKKRLDEAEFSRSCMDSGTVKQ